MYIPVLWVIIPQSAGSPPHQIYIITTSSTTQITYIYMYVDSLTLTLVQACLITSGLDKHLCLIRHYNLMWGFLFINIHRNK